MSETSVQNEQQGAENFDRLVLALDAGLAGASLLTAAKAAAVSLNKMANQEGCLIQVRMIPLVSS